MKAEYERERKRCEAVFCDWKLAMEVERLGLTVKSRYAEDYAEADHIICADTQFDWEYRHGAVTFYLPATMRLSDTELEEIVVHELVHVLVNSMESMVHGKYGKQCEFAVETTSRAFLSVRSAS